MRKLETTTDLLDAIQERYGWTDNQISVNLKIPSATVSGWRRGRMYPTEVHAITLAEALDIEPLHVLAIAAADRSPDEKTRGRWLKQIAQAVAAGFFVIPAASALYAAAQASGCILGKVGRAPARRPSAA